MLLRLFIFFSFFAEYLLEQIYKLDPITGWELNISFNDTFYLYYDLATLPYDEEGIINISVTNTNNRNSFENINARTVKIKEDEIKTRIPLKPSVFNREYPVEIASELTMLSSGTLIYHAYFNNPDNHREDFFYILCFKSIVADRNEILNVSFTPVIANTRLNIDTTATFSNFNVDLAPGIPRYYIFPSRIFLVMQTYNEVNFAWAMKSESGKEMEMTVSCGKLIDLRFNKYNVNTKREATTLINVRTTFENCGWLVVKWISHAKKKGVWSFGQTAMPFQNLPKLQSHFNSWSTNIEWLNPKERFNVIVHKSVMFTSDTNDIRNDVYFLIEPIYGEYTVRWYPNYDIQDLDRGQTAKESMIITHATVAQFGRFDFVETKTNLLVVQCTTPCAVNIIQFRNYFVNRQRESANRKPDYFNDQYIAWTKDGVYYIFLSNNTKYQLGFLKFGHFYYEFNVIDRQEISCEFDDDDHKFVLNNDVPIKSGGLDTGGEYNSDCLILSLVPKTSAIFRVIINSSSDRVTTINLGDESAEYHVINAYKFGEQFFLLNFDDKAAEIDSYSITLTKERKMNEPQENWYLYPYYSYVDKENTYIMPSFYQSKPIVLRELNKYHYEITVSNPYNKPHWTGYLTGKKSKMYFIISPEKREEDVKWKIEFRAVYKPKFDVIYDKKLVHITADDTAGKSFWLPQALDTGEKRLLHLYFYNCNEILGDTEKDKVPRAKPSYSLRMNSFAHYIEYISSTWNQERTANIMTNYWIDYWITFRQANVWFTYTYWTEDSNWKWAMNRDHSIAYDSESNALVFADFIIDGKGILYQIFVSEYDETRANKCSFIDKDSEPFETVVMDSTPDLIKHKLKRRWAKGKYWVNIVATENQVYFMSKVYDGIVTEIGGDSVEWRKTLMIACFGVLSFGIWLWCWIMKENTGRTGVGIERKIKEIEWQ